METFDMLGSPQARKGNAAKDVHPWNAWQANIETGFIGNRLNGRGSAPSNNSFAQEMKEFFHSKRADECWRGDDGRCKAGADPTMSRLPGKKKEPASPPAPWFFLRSTLAFARMVLSGFRWLPPRLEAIARCNGFLGLGIATVMVVFLFTSLSWVDH